MGLKKSFSAEEKEGSGCGSGWVLLVRLISFWKKKKLPYRSFLYSLFFPLLSGEARREEGKKSFYF